MDIKDFVKETIGSIIDASKDLQDKYEDDGVVINPPIAKGKDGGDFFEEGNITHTARRVRDVEFDIAVTASKSTQGGGKASLKIMSAEAGLDGSHQRRNEEVSRVRFSVPVALRASSAETMNKTEREDRRRQSASSRAQGPSMNYLNR
ncbi:hypothetical protein I5535_10255 [Rhodobacteraceae bacterium F11138]|nr:hypothetical protein [Rhodobacteraceae bacterium F11138]